MGCPISICISGQCALYKILPSSTYSHNTWMCLGTGESSPYMHRHHAPNPTATSPTTSTSSCEMVLYSDLANMIMWIQLEIVIWVPYIYMLIAWIDLRWMGVYGGFCPKPQFGLGSTSLVTISYFKTLYFARLSKACMFCLYGDAAYTVTVGPTAWAIRPWLMELRIPLTKFRRDYLKCVQQEQKKEVVKKTISKSTGKVSGSSPQNKLM